ALPVLRREQAREPVLEANLAGLGLRLTPEQTARLDEVSAPALNFPTTAWAARPEPGDLRPLTYELTLRHAP
ncbi:hypothetical protein ABT076_37630, partial [Streptomyces sp. NPDC002131]